MAIQISISNAIGSRGRGNIVPPFDPDAQAFITAAAITDPTQQSAINTLVSDLKGYNIWTKFKAIYPIVGGTASSHKFNLKDPRDLDAAFRLTFATGYTHSSTGMLPNGTSAYADTFYNPSLHGSINNVSATVYLRTNLTGDRASFGVLDNFFTGVALLPKWSDNNTYYGANDVIGTGASNIVSDTRGFFQTNRIAAGTKKLFRNGSVIGTATPTSSALPNYKLVYSARNYFGIIQNYDLRQIAFASIGDGLTDTEASNFYSAVQAFQTTLGRSIGTQTVSDADAQAFVNAANITDQVEANAINDLVIGMKADGLWTKMKAIYPVVGGVASSHAVNLKTPGTFNLTFASGWTHSANGMTPTNAYADTNFIPSINGTGLNNLHISYYSRNNSTSLGGEIGIYGPPYTLFFTRYNNTAYFGINGTYPQVTNTDSSGLILASRVNSTTATLYRNNNILLAAASTSTSAPAYQLTIGAIANANGVGVQYYTDRQCAFASIGDGLTDTEAANFYNRVQTFQTTLNRNV